MSQFLPIILCRSNEVGVDVKIYELYWLPSPDLLPPPDAMLIWSPPRSDCLHHQSPPSTLYSAPCLQLWLCNRTEESYPPVLEYLHILIALLSLSLTENQLIITFDVSPLRLSLSCQESQLEMSPTAAWFMFMFHSTDATTFRYSFKYFWISFRKYFYKKIDK